MNSSRQRSAFRNWSEYAAVRLLLFLLAATPRELALRLAQGMTKLLDVLVPRLRRTGLENLAFALPHLTAQQHNAILDGVFRSIARLLVSFSRFPSLNSANIGEWISCQGFEHYADGLKLGHGVLFYTAHLGNWELSAFAHALLARPMHVVVRPLDNPLIDALAARYRSASGNHLIGKKEARPILKALAANQAVGILADQDAGLEEGVFVDFFGRKASAHPGFARVAAHSKAAVVPGFALWSEKEARYVLKFYPPVEMTGDALADTQRLHQHLETVIRQYPDQWLWIHRRWKTQPPLPRLTVE